MPLEVDERRCDVSDFRKGNMDFCFLRGLLLVALTARTFGGGKCFHQKGRNQGKPVLACFLVHLLVYGNATDLCSFRVLFGYRDVRMNVEYACQYCG